MKCPFEQSAPMVQTHLNIWVKCRYSMVISCHKWVPSRSVDRLLARNGWTCHAGLICLHSWRPIYIGLAILCPSFARVKHGVTSFLGGWNSCQDHQNRGSPSRLPFYHSDVLSILYSKWLITAHTHTYIIYICLSTWNHIAGQNLFVYG